jgi:hypothetical protein
MEKAKFNNEIFYWFLIVLFGCVFIWNSYVLITTSSLITLLPLVEVFILLFLIITNNKYSRIALMICSMIFFIIASSLQLTGRLIKDLLDSFDSLDLQYYITAILRLTVGIIIYDFSKNTIEIKKTDI